MHPHGKFPSAHCRQQTSVWCTSLYPALSGTATASGADQSPPKKGYCAVSFPPYKTNCSGDLRMQRLKAVPVPPTQHTVLYMMTKQAHICSNTHKSSYSSCSDMISACRSNPSRSQDVVTVMLMALKPNTAKLDSVCVPTLIMHLVFSCVSCARISNQLSRTLPGEISRA